MLGLGGSEALGWSLTFQSWSLGDDDPINSSPAQVDALCSQHSCTNCNCVKGILSKVNKPNLWLTMLLLLLSLAELFFQLRRGTSPGRRGMPRCHWNLPMVRGSSLWSWEGPMVVGTMSRSWVCSQKSQNPSTRRFLLNSRQIPGVVFFRLFIFIVFVLLDAVGCLWCFMFLYVLVMYQAVLFVVFIMCMLLFRYGCVVLCVVRVCVFLIAVLPPLCFTCCRC